MPTVKCPNCGKKIDTAFYGACLDCGTMLPTDGQAAPVPAAPPAPAHQHSSTGDEVSQPVEQTASSTPEPSRVRRGGMGLLVRLGLAGLIFGGSALYGAINNADRDATGEIVEAGTLTANELAVGDCLDFPGSGDEVEVFESVEALPCSDLHDLEVYAIASYPSVSGTSYPGDDVLTDWGFDTCLVRFEGYVGAPYELVPDIDITIFWPSEEGWDDGDRVVQCLLIHIEDGMKLSGSMEGRDA